MDIDQIESSSAPGTVVKQFLKKIESGEMRAGQKLPTQKQLSDLFGVGRSSIREAMNALSIMGYVKIVQGKGSFINKKLPVSKNAESILGISLDNANLSHLLEIREVLECYAAKKAAWVVSDKNIVLLRNSVNRLEASANDSVEFLMADLEFHMAVGESANLPEIGDIIKSVHYIVNSNLPVIFSAHKKDKVKKSIETAKEILQHIISGEGRQAARCMRNHLSTVNDEVKNDLLQKQYTE